MKRRFARIARNNAGGRRSGFRQHTSARGRAGRISPAQIGSTTALLENSLDPSQALTPARLLALQRSVGNRAVQNLLAKRADRLGLCRADDAAAGVAGAARAAASAGVQPLREPVSSSTPDGRHEVHHIIFRQGASPGMPQPAGTQPFPAMAQPVTGPPGTVPPRDLLPGGTITFSPWARGIGLKDGKTGDWVPFTPNQTLTVGDVTNGDHGYINILVKAWWDLGDPGLGLDRAQGSSQLEFVTPFRVPRGELKEDDDKVKFSKTRPTLQFSSGFGAALDKQPSTSEDPDDGGGSVTVAPSITYQVQTAGQVQGGANINVLFVSAGANYTYQIAANTVESLSRSYTAGVHYTPKEPPKPAPDKTMKLFHETVEFGVDERVPKPDQLALLKGWWQGLFGTRPIPDEGARQAVRAGQTEVSVVGHASRTGSRQYNLVLAKDRADHVADFLKTDPDLMTSAAHLNVSSSGFDDATTKGEAQSERYVAVFFEALTEVSPAPAVAGNEEGAETAEPANA